MKPGDVVIDFNDRQFIIYSIDREFIYITDFEKQEFKSIILQQEIKEIIEKPINIEFMFLRRREKNIIDIKRYL